MDKMKRMMALLLALVMALGLAACGGGSNGGGNGGNGNGGKAEATPTPEYVYASEFTKLPGGESDRSLNVVLTTENGFYGTRNEVVGQREPYPGETRMWDGQFNRYATKLYFMGFDGSMTELKNYEPAAVADVPENAETGTGIQGMALDSQGKLLVLENAYASWNEAPEGVNYGDDSWWDYYQNKNTNFIKAKKLYEEFPELQKECEILKPLAFAFDGGAYQLLTVNKPVEKVEDLKGLTIWCEADFNDFLAGCGATTVNTPWSEVYSSLQKNMYDGLFIAVETLQACNFAEVCNYVTMVDLNYLAAPGDFMNWDSYNALPADLKALFDDPENIAFIEERMDKSGEESDAAVIEWAKSEAGTTFIELSDEEHQKFVDILNESKKSVAEEWDAQGLPGTELLNRMIELSNEY